MAKPGLYINQQSVECHFVSSLLLIMSIKHIVFESNGRTLSCGDIRISFILIAFWSIIAFRYPDLAVSEDFTSHLFSSSDKYQHDLVGAMPKKLSDDVQSYAGGMVAFICTICVDDTDLKGFSWPLEVDRNLIWYPHRIRVGLISLIFLTRHRL